MTLASVRPVSAKFDPAFEWTTLETAHFLIHYHQGGSETALRAARIAEDVHRRLAPRVGWEPAERTRLVLVDATDDPNGYATPVPYNQIVIYLTAPSGWLGLGLVSYDDWLRVVITHEYTHILQLDMVHGLPDALQYVFGRIYFPNLFQPRWLIEGLATYEETEQTSGGRGRSPAAEMVLRMAVLEERFPSLAQMAVFPDSWPAGQVPYLFGESFTRFIADSYGRQALADISRTYSGRTVPFLVESTALRTIGRRYDELWSAWKASLFDRFHLQADAVRTAGLTASTALTRAGFAGTGPAFSPDGTAIAYALVDGDEYPGIYLMAADGSNARKLVETVFPYGASGQALAWSPDGRRIYYTANEIVRNTSAYNDLMVYDSSTGKATRLTEGVRGRDPAVSPDGKWIAFVATRLGSTRLVFLNIEQERTAPAREADLVPVTDWSTDQYETPAWNPDGERIAVSIWRSGGFRDIRIIDRAGTVLDEVTNDRAIDLAPAWSPDGRALYFSSDRSGIFNIYRYDLADRSLLQVTNVLGGAFAPSLSPDGATLVFSSYSSRGYDIHTLTLDPSAERAAVPAPERYPAANPDEPAVETAIRPYSPLSTIYPRFWLPTVGVSGESGTMIGAFTLHEDASQRHRYLASVYYGPSSGRTWYSLDYFYEGFRPTLQFHVADNDTTHSGFLEDATGSASYVERTKMIGGVAIFPLLTYAREQWLIVEYQQRRISALTDLPPWPGYAGPLPAQGLLAAARTSYLFTSTHEYAYSFGPEDGRKLEFGVERYDKTLGSDLEYTRYTADWREYLDLPGRHQVLLARAFYGTSTGSGPPQGVFELGGDPLGEITTTLDDAYLSLRGYPLNVLRGRKAAVGTLEYRFPIVNLERGADTGPFFFRRLHGALFVEAGEAWDGSYRSSDLRRAVGAELRMNILFSYYLPVTLRLVAAKGLDDDGEKQFYFAFWVPADLWE